MEETSQGAMEGKGTSSGEMGVGQEDSARQGQGGHETRCMTEVEQSQRHGRRGALVAPCYVWSHFYYPLLIVN